MAPTATVARRGAERLRSGHPWIYQSDVRRVEAEPGDVVRVLSETGRALGWAFFSSTSLITLRVITDDPAETDVPTLIARRLGAAVAYRDTLGLPETGSAWRLVHAESDRLPATVVDRYGDGDDVYLVFQTMAQGSDRHRDLLVAWLVERFAPRAVVERNDSKMRELEGLPSRAGVVWGDVPEGITISEGGVRYAVDLLGGQKTGLFLDQRDNHAAAARYTRGRALDAFTYQGGFALQMARQAESVLALDSSAAAVAVTRANAAANGLGHVEVREANVFDELRELEIAGARFDTIALDPPAFAKSKHAVERAVAGYKEINLRALRLLRPGGHLITCSCSYNVDEDLFLEIVRQASVDAHAPVWLVERRMQSRDHPVLVGVPETQYLKCLVLRRIG